LVLKVPHITVRGKARYDQMNCILIALSRRPAASTAGEDISRALSGVWEIPPCAWKTAPVGMTQLKSKI